ncbi:MAG: hypothetical protein R3B70_11500 [Polyangiaceae bacterium]
MNKTTAVLWVGILSVLGFTACNYTDGLCYLQEDLDGYEGAGGGVIVPGGEGGFGDVPPTPQAADPEGFECNEVGGYSASLFKFKTTVPDDGKDAAGGAQQASATLKFVVWATEPTPILDLSDHRGATDPSGGIRCDLSVQGRRDVGRRRDAHKHARDAQS